MFKMLPAVLLFSLIGVSGSEAFAQHGHGKRNKHHGHKSCHHCRPEREVHVYRRGPDCPPLVLRDVRRYPVRRYDARRAYYRSPEGYHYWQGRDGYLYLDVKFVQRDRYHNQEFSIWVGGNIH